MPSKVTGSSYASPFNVLVHAPLTKLHTLLLVPRCRRPEAKEKAAAVTTSLDWSGGIGGQTPCGEILKQTQVAPLFQDSLSPCLRCMATKWPDVIGSNATLNRLEPVTWRVSSIVQVVPASVLRYSPVRSHAMNMSVESKGDMPGSNIAPPPPPHQRGSAR